MAKRVNPHRRLLAAQMALRRDLVSAGNAEDAGKLQEGAVRSPLTTIYRGHTPPRPAIWEGSGVSGKVIRGALKRTIPGTKSRFAPK